MISEESKSVAAQARKIYEEQLKHLLQQAEHGRYVSIEPESGDHFLADRFDEAINAALAKYPDKLTHTIRIGHGAALLMGFLIRRLIG